MIMNYRKVLEGMANGYAPDAKYEFGGNVDVSEVEACKSHILNAFKNVCGALDRCEERMLKRYCADIKSGNARFEVGYDVDLRKYMFLEGVLVRAGIDGNYAEVYVSVKDMPNSVLLRRYFCGNYKSGKDEKDGYDRSVMSQMLRLYGTLVLKSISDALCGVGLQAFYPF